MESAKENALAMEKEKALAIAKEKEKALAIAKEKENALAKEEKSLAKEKQKSLARKNQEAWSLQKIVLKDISVKEEEIGRGASGVVSKVTWHGTECAAKSIHPILVEGTIGNEFNDVKDRFLKECSICARLSHPNIVHFYGVYYPPHSGVPLLIMELMDSSLSKCIAKYPDIPFHMKLSFLHDISLGIRYLHSHEPPIVHRDLSSNNVLITKGGIAKVADLGVARIIDIADTKLTRAPGTLDFMPPEALKEEPVYQTPLDVFSYGGIMIHCMSGQWPTPKEAVAVDPVTRLVVGFPEHERRSHLIEKMGDVEELKSLTRRCLDNVPEARPSMVEISEKICFLKNGAIKSSQIAMMNMLDKDIALAKYMTPRLLSDSSEQPGRPRSPHPRAKSSSLKTTNKPLSWRSCDPMPQGMRSPKAVECNGNIYVGGGDTGDQSVSAFKVYVYNIAKEKWSSLSPTPQRWFAIAVLKGKLLVIGGACHENAVTGQVTVLDETNGHWYSEYPPMPTSRSDPGAIGHLNHLIVIGGFDGVQSVDVVEVLDASNNQWSQVASLPYTITSVTPMLQGDVLYLAGGFSVTKGKQAAKKLFTCASIPMLLKSTLPSVWKELSPVPFSYSSTTIHDESFFTFCGRDSTTKQDSSAVYLYDAVKNTWSQVRDMPTYRRMCTAISAATNGKIYVLGGIVSKTKYSDIVECSI